MKTTATSHEWSYDQPKLKKGIYRHYKNKKLYEVQNVARHTETEEWVVIYKPLYKSDFADLDVRPYEMFFEKVKDPETGKLVPRFAYVRSKYRN
jgi:hypothetical protein